MRVNESMKITCTPDWCGSVGWASSSKLKGVGFDSWSGHLPGLKVRSPAWVEAQVPGWGYVRGN